MQPGAASNSASVASQPSSLLNKSASFNSSVSSMNVNSHSSHSGNIKTANNLEWSGDAMDDAMGIPQSDADREIEAIYHQPAISASSSAVHNMLHPNVDYVEDDLESMPEEVHDKSSVNSSVFVLSATTLGAGILSLPYAFSEVGWLFGSLLLIFVGIVSSYAIRLLLASARAVGATTYEDLGYCIFPKYGKQVVVTSTLVLIFGSLTAFFVIIADTVTPAVQSITGNSTSFFTRREVLLCLVAFLIVFPLCLLRSIHSLERWSFLAVGIILLFSGLIVEDAARKLLQHEAGPNADGTNPNVSEHVKLFLFSTDLFEALPIICLAFTCQTMIFPIWNSLLDESVHIDAESSNTLLAGVGAMQSVVDRALLLCGSLYLPVGVFGFFSFGLSTKGDVLNNFPNNNVFYDLVRILFTLAICIHYPVVHFGFRSAILTTWYASATEKENRKRFWIITICTVACSLVLAVALHNLSTVFSVTGAVCAFPYCFMFPTLFYLRLHTPGVEILRMKSKHAHASEQDHFDEASENGGAIVPVGAVVPASNDGNQYNNYGGNGAQYDANGASRTAGGRAYHAVAANQHSPLLSSGSLPPLTQHQRIPAIALFVGASILWIISIVVTFKDMVNDIKTNGI